MSWEVGDRVRLGRVRGGVVFNHFGRLRARWPDGVLGWLDYCVPDEGPDGPIDVNSYEHCRDCGNPSPGFFCVNCERRSAEAARWRPPAPPPPAPAQPSVAIHLAAEPGPDRVQRCARCAAVLSHPQFGPGGPYHAGALVERGHGWQAINLAATAATCEAP